MSPEQARGAETDFRSDQFSFGLTLFEMLTGRSAFRRETLAATLDAIGNDEPPMAALDARTPLQLRWIIERCLAKDPGERYGVTGDLHRDLRTLRDRLGDVVSRETQTSRCRNGARAWRRALVWRRDAGVVAAGAIVHQPSVEPPRVDAAALTLFTARDRSWIRRTAGVVAGRADDRLRRRSQRHPPDLHATPVLADVGRSSDPRPVRLQASVLVTGREAHLLHLAGDGPGEHLVRRCRGWRAAGRDRERDPRRGRARWPHAGLSSRRAAWCGRRHRCSVVVHTGRWRALVEPRRRGRGPEVRRPRRPALQRGRARLLARRHQARSVRRPAHHQSGAGEAWVADVDSPPA